MIHTFTTPVKTLVTSRRSTYCLKAYFIPSWSQITSFNAPICSGSRSVKYSTAKDSTEHEFDWWGHPVTTDHFNICLSVCCLSLASFAISLSASVVFHGTAQILGIFASKWQHRDKSTSNIKTYQNMKRQYKAVMIQVLFTVLH